MRVKIPTTMVVLAVLGLSACGGAASVRSPSSGAGGTGGGYPSGPDLQRILGNSFRVGLARLAVMSQPGDDAADLGQHLSTGLLAGTSCEPAGSANAAGKRTARCVVRWKTVDGASEKTAYAVQLTDHGCVYASAKPRLREVFDATTHAPSEHPLSFLVRARKGC